MGFLTAHNGLSVSVSNAVQMGQPRRSNVFSTTTAAYALRIPAGSTYSGPLIRVRRSSDNAESDFSAVIFPDVSGNRWIDTVALLAFVTSGGGFVTTWYDQSGNGRHATQASLLSQPRIVTAGVLDTSNGRPTLVFSGTQCLYATSPSNPLASAFTQNAVGTGAGVLVALSTTAANNQNSCLGAANMSAFGAIGPWYGGYGQDSTFFATASASSATSILTKTFTGGTGTILGYRNGNQVFSKSDSYTAGNTQIAIGVQTFNNFQFLNGSAQEVFIALSVLSASARRNLELSQGAAFSITVA